MNTILLLFTFAFSSQSWSLSHSSSIRVSMTERMGCRLHIYIHFRGGSSSFPFSSSFCWLSSLAISSKYSFKNYYPWLSSSSVTSSVVTSYNSAFCTSLLMSSTMFSTGSNPEVVHEFWEKCAPHSIQTFH